VQSPPDKATAGRVVIIALGGTIAMSAATTGGVVPALSAHDLVNAVPGLADLGFAVEASSFRTKPGASLTFDDLTDLAATIGQHFQDGAVGVVVTQGTDTIEETAYLLDLLHDGPQPLVVTGAMRNPTLAGADGPANLLAAVTVAASTQARDLGVLVVVADEIHAARRVQKTHSTSPSTFVSAIGGPLGYLVEGTPQIVNRLDVRYRIPGIASGSAGRVGLYSATLGDDGSTLAAVAARLDGLVIAGFGVGHVPETWVPTLAEIAAKIPVVLASRTGSGPVLSSTYGFPGSERDLLSRGLIPAGFLDPYKARILLHLALRAGADHAQIAEAFTAAGGLGDPQAWPWQARTASPLVETGR
jgi:L-asparaginase